MSQTRQRRPSTLVVQKEITNTFMRGVYLWMTAGLSVTAVTAWYAAHSPSIMSFIFEGNTGLIVLLIAQFGIVMALSSAINKMSAGMATAMFILYSALTGLTFSLLLLVYPSDAFVKAFAVSAATFGGMSLYGLVTKRDLTGMGSFMSVGLFGIIIAMLINFFTQSPALDYAICVLGVVIFLGLTAFDTQKLRNMGENAPQDDPTALRRGTIMGALTLYLDFINLFLLLLRLFGSRR